LRNRQWIVLVFAVGALLALGFTRAAQDVPVFTWAAAWPPLLSLVGGVAGRAFLPYILTGLKVVQDEKTWAAWPKFEPVYVTTFLASAIGYAVILATVMGVFERLLGLTIREAAAVGYGLADLTREVTKNPKP